MANPYATRICETCNTEFPHKLSSRRAGRFCSRDCRYSITPEERFWAKVEKTETCWLWTASVDTHGYGQIVIDGKTRLAHRIAWVLAHGPIPAGMQVLHRCDTPRCVRSDHFFLGSNADNVADRARKGRGASKLTEDDVRAIRISTASDRALGFLFGIKTQHVFHIRSRKSWSHVQ